MYSHYARVDIEVKLNCVVLRGFNDDEIADFVDLARRLPVEVFIYAQAGKGRLS